VLGSLLYQKFCLRGVADVGLNGDCLPADFLEDRDGFGSFPGRRVVIDGNLRAGAGERDYDSAANAVRSAGNECGFAA
jgi:hypothetical protein